MKLLLYLLLPVILVAQPVNFPDTLQMHNNKIYPCYVLDMNDSWIKFRFAPRNQMKIGPVAIKQLKLKGLGLVYQAPHGFFMDRDSLKSFVRKRAGITTKSEKRRFISGVFKKVFGNGKPEKRCSFGVMLYPAQPEKRYDIQYSPFYTGPQINVPIEILTPTQIESQMEAHLAFRLIPRLYLTTNVLYSLYDFTGDKEYHYLNIGNDTDYTENQIHRVLLSYYDIYIGLKYYVLPADRKVRLFFQTSIGKQYTSAEGEIAMYLDNEKEEVFQDNAIEFLKNLNSPSHFSYGFGAEYAFNPSLALVAQVVFKHSRIKARYDFRYNYTDMDKTESGYQQFNLKDVSTKIGIGLNLYF